jgi:DNA-binding NtrC family response regulator
MLDLGPASSRPTNEVFVVDDDEDVQSLLTAALAPEDYPVETFGSEGPSCAKLLDPRIHDHRHE